MATTSERRLSPRSRLAIDCGIFEDTEPLRTLTFDVSSRGLSCVLPREIPLFTKVRVVLQVPQKTAEEDADGEEIRCEGVVVRRERMDEGSNSKYKTAIFFSRIEPNDATLLHDYVAEGHA